MTAPAAQQPQREYTMTADDYILIAIALFGMWIGLQIGYYFADPVGYTEAVRAGLFMVWGIQ
jgi:hypothetical protein